MSPAVWPAGTTAPPVITTWSVAADAVPAPSTSASSADSNAAIAARTAWGVDISTLLEARVEASVAFGPARRKAHVAALTHAATHRRPAWPTVGRSRLPLVGHCDSGRATRRGCQRISVST